MFEKRALLRIFVLKSDEVTREELNDLYSSPNVVRVIKSIRKKWEGNVAHMGREEVYEEFWWGNLRERDHLEDPAVGGNIAL